MKFIIALKLIASLSSAIAAQDSLTTPPKNISTISYSRFFATETVFRGKDEESITYDIYNPDGTYRQERLWRENYGESKETSFGTYYINTNYIYIRWEDNREEFYILLNDHYFNRDLMMKKME